jgi:hypothetical protein
VSQWLTIVTRQYCNPTGLRKREGGNGYVPENVALLLTVELGCPFRVAAVALSVVRRHDLVDFV